jgi:OmpA-OmpF porin, OOP family
MSAALPANDAPPIWLDSLLEGKPRGYEPTGLAISPGVIMQRSDSSIHRSGLFAIVWLGAALVGLGAGCLGVEGAGGGEGEQVSPASSASRHTFQAGTMIIPVDRGAQDLDELPAYGLAYELLRNNVPVHWAIKSDKTDRTGRGVDVTVEGSAMLDDLKTRAAITLPAEYRGGPFLIDAADRLAAMPIVDAWRLSHPVTVVHTVTAGSFTADIAKTLTAAPRMAVLNDGNQQIAYAAFKAAGILDSKGADWSDGSPDVLTQEDVANHTMSMYVDGGLWNADGSPKYCHLISMHYNVATDQASKDLAQQVVDEVKDWLQYTPDNSAFMQCAAVDVFENRGHFLTANGLSNGGLQATALSNQHPEAPLTQTDGALVGVTGAVASIKLSSMLDPRSGVQPLVIMPAAVTGQPDTVWLLSGPLDGKPANGTVTYLGGHDYLAGTPVPGGVRVLLNSLLDAGCAAATGDQPKLTLNKRSPVYTTDNQITYTIEYANIGNVVANDVTITDQLPAGTTFVSASNRGKPGAKPDDGTVTWGLGSVQAGELGSVTVTVGVTADGPYTNTAVLHFTGGGTTTRRTVTSSSATTTRATRDSDGDSVPDQFDNCPDRSNAEQLDLDQNGQGDACDRIGVSGGGCSTGGGGLGIGALVVLASLTVLSRRRRGVLAAAVLAAVALPRLASAQLIEPGNFGVERFQLASDRDGLLNVEWAEVRGNMAVSAALWAGLANDPLVLYRSQPGQRIGSLVANRAGGSLSASISPRDWLQIGLDLPLVIYQDRPASSVISSMGLDSLHSFGTSNLRVIPKLVVLHQADHGISVAVIPTVSLPTRSTRDSYFDDHGFGFAPEVVVSRRWTGWRASATAGYAARERTTFMNQVVDDELFAHAGVGYQLADRGGAPVGIDVTLSGATAARAPFQRVNEDHLEALVGATYDFRNGAQLFGGAGAGLRKGYGTPDWRGFVGVRIGFDGPSKPPARRREPDSCPTPPSPPSLPPLALPPPLPPASPAPEVPPASEVPPVPPPAVTVGTCSLDLKESVYFKTDRAEIDARSFDLLDNVTDALVSHGELKIQVEGHTDSQGNDGYNKTLSQHRAESVVAYLVKKGIDRSRLTARGFGEEKPISDNTTEAGRAQNRRVVFAIPGCVQGAGDEMK